MTVTYLPRSEWDNSGAARLGYSIPASQVVGMVCHHTVTIHAPAPGLGDEINHMRRLRTIRPDLGLDVPYTGVVFRGEGPDDAVLAEGRGPGRTGAHTHGYNSTRYGIAYAGNSSADAMTPGVLEAFRLAGRMWLPHASEATVGHGDLPNQGTSCPGTWLRDHLPDLQPPFAETLGPASEDEEDPMAAKMRQFVTPASGDIPAKVWGVWGCFKVHIVNDGHRGLLIARGLLEETQELCGNVWDLDNLHDVTPGP